MNNTYTHCPYAFPFTMPLLSAAFDKYDVVLRPDTDAAEWWAGAPSVVRGPDGAFWLACRMRTADAPRGLRGYEIRILRSDDGIHFEPLHRIRREDVPVPGFERPALIIDSGTGLFKLYGCAPVEGAGWSIVKWDDAPDPTQFKPSTARVVISGPPPEDERDIRPREFKDPVVCHDGARYHAYTIGYVRGTERIFHFVSEYGDAWRPVGHSTQGVMGLDGWHNFFVRPASLLRVGPGWLFFYEGSNTAWHDPVYNIATGLAFTFDLHHIIDLTPDAPMVASSTPGTRFATWRYSHWMRVGDEIWVYAEVACPNETNEVRLFRLPGK